MPAPSNGKVLACDVDGTLIVNGSVSAAVVATLRRWKAEGGEVIVWSARGTEHAQKAVRQAAIEGLVAVVIGKPSHLLDDKGATWIRFCRRILPKL